MQAARTRPTIAVVGGGISGLVAARELHRSGAADVVVVEAADRLGGKITTVDLHDRRVDVGPDSFLTRHPHARQLCEDLGLGDRLVRQGVQKTMLWSRDRLRPVPSGLMLGLPTDLPAVVRSGVLSPLGSVRAVGDLLLPKAGMNGDVSIGEVVRRRFGRQVLDRLVEPFLGGIYGGGVDELSLHAVMPQVEAVLREHRSIVLGSRAARRRATPGAQPPMFLGLEGGFSGLVEALAADLRDVQLLTGAELKSLVRAEDGRWELDAGGQHLGADAVVLATPATAASELLREVAPSASRELASIRYTSTAIVVLALPGDAGQLPGGASGFLVPMGEGRALKACSWMSAKWPYLQDDDGVQIVRLSVRWRRASDLDDDELAGVAREELRQAAGVSGRPIARVVRRWERAFPQYAVGHLDRVDRIEAALPQGLVLAGAAYRGLGLPDCVRQGQEAASRALAHAAASVA